MNQHLCTVASCTELSLVRELCSRHYYRLRKYGNPLVSYSLLKTSPELVKQRFEIKVSKTDHCWLWNAGQAGNGYGAFQMEGRRQYAHRVSYELHVGPIPDGMIVRHACDVPLCVNPAHLLVGTQADNMADAAQRGRLHKPRDHSGDQAEQIRQLYESGDYTQRALADAFNLTQPRISQIVGAAAK